MDLQVSAAPGAARGIARWGEQGFPCALGPTGLKRDKREGDGATPIGRFPLRRVLYRPDRLAQPATGLELQPLTASDGWCDDPADPAYNRPVRLPYPARHETLWRADGVYDVIVVIGHNDDPPVPGAGSAVFLHVARDDYTPTEGCVALALPDLLRVLAEAKPGDALMIELARPRPPHASTGSA